MLPELDAGMLVDLYEYASVLGRVLGKKKGE